MLDIYAQRVTGDPDGIECLITCFQDAGQAGVDLWNHQSECVVDHSVECVSHLVDLAHNGCLYFCHLVANISNEGSHTAGQTSQ